MVEAPALDEARLLESRTQSRKERGQTGSQIHTDVNIAQLLVMAGLVPATHNHRLSERVETEVMGPRDKPGDDDVYISAKSSSRSPAI
jgi:hypothetical protein